MPTSDQARSATPIRSAAEPSSQARTAELMRSAQLGDRAAFGQIVQLYQHRLFNALLRLVGNPDDAAELCQETFVRALAGLTDFRGQAGPYTWMFRIATNLALTELRKQRRRRTFTLGDGQPTNGRVSAGHQADALVQRLQSTAPPPDEQAQQREQQQRVVEALGRIDEDQRALIVMRDIEGFDYQQIAQILDIPLGTLKSRLFRARLALSQELRSSTPQAADSAKGIA